MDYNQITVTMDYTDVVLMSHEDHVTSNNADIMTLEYILGIYRDTLQKRVYVHDTCIFI